MAAKKRTAAARYSGTRLHEKVLEAAETEAERGYVKAWGDVPEGARLKRPAGGWASFARRNMFDELGQGWGARFIPKRAALVKALREARADADVWLALTSEDPALKKVRLDQPREEPPALRAERLALIAEDPGLEDLLTWRPAEWPERVASEREKATLGFRLGGLGLLDHCVGPTWYRRAPTNRDLALLVILSGWICDGWKGEMTIAEAIEAVVAAVRMHRARAQPK